MNNNTNSFNEETLVDLIKFLQEKNIIDFKFEYNQKNCRAYLIINSKYKYPIRENFNLEKFKICLNKCIEDNLNRICFICDENPTKLGCITCGNRCCNKCYIRIFYNNRGQFICPNCRYVSEKNKDITTESIGRFTYKMVTNPKLANINICNLICENKI